MALERASVCGDGCLRLNPAFDASIEQIERKAAAREDLIVERADVEFRTELFRSTTAKLANLQLADLVAARLAGPGDVAIGLGLDRRLVDRVRLAHEVDDLIAAPSQMVNAGVHHETDGAEKLRTET